MNGMEGVGVWEGGNGRVLAARRAGRGGRAAAPVEGVGRVAYRARRPPRRVELARAPRQRVHEHGVGVALNLKGGTQTWAQVGVRDGISGSVVGMAVGTRACGVTHGLAGGAMIMCSRRSTIGASSDTWKDSRRCWNSATILSYCSCACTSVGIGRCEWRKWRTRTGADPFESCAARAPAPAASRASGCAPPPPPPARAH